MAGNSDRPPAPPPAGWFSDPAGSPYLRWWDGSGWTDNFIDARTGAPPAELAPAPSPRGAIAASIAAEPIEPSASDPVVDSGPTVSVTPAAEAPPLTRREARARERLEEEARARAGVVQPHDAAPEPTVSTTDAPEAPGSEPTAPDVPAATSPAEYPSDDDLDEVDAEDLFVQPVSAANAVETLGEVPEPDAVAAPEQDSAVGAIGIPAAAAVPTTAGSPSPDSLFDFAGIAPAGTGPTAVSAPVTPPNAWATPANAWASAPAPAAADGFPIALNGATASAPAESRAPAAEIRDAPVATWAVWLFAVVPALHLALAWAVFDQLAPADESILRWVVLFGPIILYLLLAGLDRWTLLRGGQLAAAPVVYAIIPPLYLAIRVVRMGVRALVPLIVWIVLQAAAVAALVFALPAVYSAISGR